MKTKTLEKLAKELKKYNLNHVAWYHFYHTKVLNVDNEDCPYCMIVNAEPIIKEKIN